MITFRYTFRHASSVVVCSIKFDSVYNLSCVAIAVWLSPHNLKEIGVQWGERVFCLRIGSVYEHAKSTELGAKIPFYHGEKVPSAMHWMYEYSSRSFPVRAFRDLRQ